MISDRQQRVTLARSDVSRHQLVATARTHIYDKHYGVDSTVVESLLKSDAWVPTSVSLAFSIFLALTDP
jgi:hypothetical protein